MVSIASHGEEEEEDDLHFLVDASLVWIGDGEAKRRREKQGNPRLSSCAGK